MNELATSLVVPNTVFDACRLPTFLFLSIDGNRRKVVEEKYL